MSMALNNISANKEGRTYWVRWGGLDDLVYLIIFMSFERANHAKRRE